MKKSGARFRAERPFSFWLALAVVMHLVLFAGLLAYQKWAAVRPFKPRIVTVSLLSMPGGGEPGGGGSPAAAVSEPAPAREPEPAPVPQPPKKPEVSAPEKKVPKVADPLKPKKTVPDPKSVPAEKAPDIQKAIADLKKKVDARAAAEKAASQDNLQRALSRLKASVSQGTGGSGSGSGSQGSGSGTGGGGGTADAYLAAVVETINRNWNFNSQMLQRTDGMEVYVEILVLRDGTIQQIVFVKPSLSPYLNNSVKNALERSSPLPPRSDGPPSERFKFVFTPKGIDR